MKTIPITILCTGMALFMTGCDKKDDNFNTDHPDQGQITLTTDWTQRTAGIDIPASYTVAVDKYSVTVSNATNMLDNLFDPGTYHIRIYTTPQHITVSGATATVAEAPGNVDGVGQFVQEMPGWLFTSTLDAAIEADTDHDFAATMHQQVRQLTLFIEPTGGTTHRIARIEGYLSGVASIMDMDNNTHGAPQNVALVFTQIADGENAGKWTTTVRLLGIAGERQKLSALITFADDTPEALWLDSDLSDDLATFNADKATPLVLGGRMVTTPTDAGFIATIKDWTPGIGSSGVAD